MSTAVLSAYVTCNVCKKGFPRRATLCPNCTTPNRPPRRVPGADQACYQCGKRLPMKSNICAECGFVH